MGLKGFLKRKFIKLRHYYLRSYNSYSQDGEDLVLRAFFEEENRQSKGFFVDVGAHHPIRFSNTYYFYKKGWRGINIDPTPGAMQPFNWFRKRDINLNLGVASKKKQLTFYCFKEPAVNTFSKKQAIKFQQAKGYQLIKEIAVNVLPLSEILDTYLPANTEIDFFSIDVEGLDLEVLQSNNWLKYKPHYVLVEDIQVNLNHLSESKIYQFLTELGYIIIAKTLRTLIFKRSNV